MQSHKVMDIKMPSSDRVTILNTKVLMNPWILMWIQGDAFKKKFIQNVEYKDLQQLRLNHRLETSKQICFQLFLHSHLVVEHDIPL